MGIFTILSGIVISGATIAFGLVEYFNGEFTMPAIDPQIGAIFLLGAGLIATMFMMYRSNV